MVLKLLEHGVSIIGTPLEQGVPIIGTWYSNYLNTVFQTLRVFQTKHQTLTHDVPNI